MPHISLGESYGNVGNGVVRITLLNLFVETKSNIVLRINFSYFILVGLFVKI